jgi:methylglutaconyl-CoA hydratase
MQEPLDIATDDLGVVRLTINRPKKGNSFDPALTDALAEALDRIAKDRSLRMAVLTASGQVFSGGVDLAWMRSAGSASYEANYQDALKLAKLLYRLHTLPIPTVASVPGRAIGLGVGLAAACDIAIAADTASFRFSEVRLGILPAVISPYVVGALGIRACQRTMLTGEALDAREAMRLGLVHRICGFEELPAATDEMAAELLAGGAGAQTAIKALLGDMRRPKIDAALIEDTARRLTDLRSTPEAQAALAAFFNR